MDLFLLVIVLMELCLCFTTLIVTWFYVPGYSVQETRAGGSRAPNSGRVSYSFSGHFVYMPIS